MRTKESKWKDPCFSPIVDASLQGRSEALEVVREEETGYNKKATTNQKKDPIRVSRREGGRALLRDGA